MADDTITNGGGEDKNPLDSRLKDLLADKARLSQDVEAKEKTLKEQTDRLASLEREKAFSDGFADVLGSHQAAKDHKEEIKAKVMSGYSVEDATFAVLGKMGKLGTSPAPVQSPAGGSAPNVITGGASKSPAEMTQAERRESLAKDLIWS